MGMCASGDIFQAKVDELLGNIEGIKTYTGDKLVLIKCCLKNHIEQLRIIFGRLCASGLNKNAPKFSFGLKEIPYLRYVITKEGIKSYQKKVEDKMDLERSITTN